MHSDWTSTGFLVGVLLIHALECIQQNTIDINFFSASNPVVVEKEELKNLPLSSLKAPRKFCIEHPFLFFIVDRLDNLVVVAGKVVDPQQPTPFEI